MKKLILIAAASLVAVGAFAQGQFFFSNRDVNATPPVDARFYAPGDAPGVSSVGAGYTVNLFGGTAGSASLAAVGTTTFRSSSAAAMGYVNPIPVTVPGVASAAQATVRVDVMSASGQLVFSQPYTFALGGDTITPPTIPMGNQPLTLTPEPATLALAGLGLGALLLIRRRK
jgi:hypothetical protein